MMKLLQSNSIGRLHELVVEYILEYGSEVLTEDGAPTLETDAVTLYTSTPLSEPMISTRSPLHDDFVNTYAYNLINGSESNFEYDYHTRLFEWGKNSSVDVYRTDQIQYIIDKLAVEPNSRRAQAITWIPPDDVKLRDCPCLQHVQCKVRDNKLHMSVVFRSNDMLLGAGSNMYAFVYLQKYILDQLNLKTNSNITMGSYTHIALIPHIYVNRDIDELKIKYNYKGKKNKQK